MVMIAPATIPTVAVYNDHTILPVHFWGMRENHQADGWVIDPETGVLKAASKIKGFVKYDDIPGTPDA